MVPAVAVYFISWPPILTACLVWTTFSSGFFSSLVLSVLSPGFSAPFSPDLSPAFCCCAFAAAENPARTNIITRLHVSRLISTPGNGLDAAFRILCDYHRTVNLLFRDRVNNVRAGPFSGPLRAKGQNCNKVIQVADLGLTTPHLDFLNLLLRLHFENREALRPS